MVRKYAHKRWLALAAAVAGVNVAGGASRADLQWDVSDPGLRNGDGDWNTTDENWRAGAANVSWPTPPASDVAVFGGNGAVLSFFEDQRDFRVTITSAVTASGLRFNEAGFTIDRAASNVLTLSGTPAITTNADAAILAPMAGTAFTKNGAATLFLHNNANSFGPGAISVTAGRLALLNSAAAGNAANTITLDGGTLLLNNVGTSLTADVLQLNRAISVGAGGGTLEVPTNSSAAYLLANGLSTTAPGNALTKTGLGTLFIVSPQSYGGPIVIDSPGGTIDIRSGGKLTGTGSVTVGQSARLDVDNESGVGLFPNTNDNDRVASTVGITLNGGRLQYRSRNVALSGASSSEVFGTVTLGVGQSEIRAERTGNGGSDLIVTDLVRQLGGGTVRFTAGNTISNAGDNGRITLTNVNGAALGNSGFIGAWALVNSSDYAGYTVPASVGAAGGVRVGTYAATTGTGDAALFTPANVVSMGHDVTLPAGNASVGALRLAGGATRNLSFTNATDTLFIESGGILSDGSGNARNIGTTATRGQVTAGSTGATTAQELFLHNNSNTMTVNSVIIDNPNNAAARVTVIKDLDGQVNLEAEANSYSGGTFVLRGTLEARAAGTLGTGPATVRNARLQLNAAGAIGGTSTNGYAAVDNGEVRLNNVGVDFSAATDRFNIAAGSMLSGRNTTGSRGLNSVSRVGALTGGGQAVLAPDAIVAHEDFFNNGDNGVANATTFNTVRSLGTAADLFFGLRNTANAGADQAVTVGTGTPWKGISTDRDNRTWAQGTIVANSDFVLQGLTRDGGIATLQLGDGTGGTYRINTNGALRFATVVGNVALAETEAPVLDQNLTFVVSPGATLFLNQPNQLGGASDASVNARVRVQAGGTIDTGNVSGTINGIVNVDAGGRLLANEASGLGTAGAVGEVNFAPRSILEISGSAATAITGNTRLNIADGAIIRLANISNPVGVGATATTPSRLTGNGAIFEVYVNNQSITGQANPENVTSDGGGFTNDSSSRQFNSGAGRVIVGPRGSFMAATTNTTLTFNDNFDLGDNTLTIGLNDSIAGNPKGANAPVLNVVTAVQLNNGGSLGSAQSRIYVTPNYQLQQNVTQNAIPNLTTVELDSNASLRLLQNNFTETIGALVGTGNVVASQTGAVLQAGYNNQDATFAGAFTTTFDPNATSNANVAKVGTGTWSLTGASNWTGTLTVNQGTVRLAGSGTGGTVAFGTDAVNKGGALTLDNAAAAVNNRLGGTTGTKTITLSGGGLNLIGSGGGSVLEQIGTLNVANAGGTNVITITPGAGGSTTFQAGTLQATNNVNLTTTTLLRGPGLGSTPGAGVATFIANTPNLFAGVGAAGPYNRSVRPDILGDTSVTGTGTGFVTQTDTTNGFRLLTAAEMFPLFYNGYTASANNVRLATAGTFDLGDTAVNTLTFAAGGSVSGTTTAGIGVARGQGARLFVNSGGILVPTGVSASIAAPFLDRGGNQPYFVHANGNLAINATIVGNQGLVKSGPGTLSLGAGALQALTGRLSVNDGTLALGANNSLPVTNNTANFDARDLYVSGGTVQLNGNGQTVNNLLSSSPIPNSGGSIVNTGARATLAAQQGTFAGTVGGAIDLLKYGTGTLTLTSPSNFNGSLTLRGGSLNLRDDAALTGIQSTGAGQSIAMNVSTLNLGDSANSLSNVANRIPAGSNLTLRGSTFQLNGFPGANDAQSLGRVLLDTGMSQVSSSAGVSGSTEITIASLDRSSARGVTVNLTGNNLGRLAPAGFGNQDSRIFLQGFDGAAGAPADNSFLGGWVVANGTHFASYRGDRGVGQFSDTGNAFPAYATAFGTGNVTQFTASTAVPAAGGTVAALRLSGNNTNITFAGAGGLTIESGGLLMNNAAEAPRDR